MQAYLDDAYPAALSCRYGITSELYTWVFELVLSGTHSERLASMLHGKYEACFDEQRVSMVVQCVARVVVLRTMCDDFREST